MKKLISTAIAIATFAAITCSCGKTEATPQPTDAEGVFVVNSGSMGKNNACISVYNPTTKKIVPNAFKAANGVGLGDTAQDILSYNGYEFISVTNSKVIFVTNDDLKLLKQIVFTNNGTALSPRYLAISGKKVYVTLYEGWLGEINLATFETRMVKVGRSPEGVAVCNGKIYVANSGGADYPNYDNTVSVIDVDTFTETSKITVNTNPCSVKACGSNVYVYSIGDYGATPSKLQVIKNGTVSDVTDYSSVAGIASSGNSLYVLTGEYDKSWKLTGTVWLYDGAEGKAISEIMDGISNAYSIAVTDNYIWIGCSDYINNGDVVVINIKTLAQVDEFDSQGLNPITVAQ